MHLDMQTIAAVNVAVTAILGAVLVFTWAHERASQFVGWWGLALLIQAAGVALAAASSPANANELLAIGTASIILGDAVKWKASREFAHHRAHLLWVLLGPVGFLLVMQTGFLSSFDDRLGAVCVLLALYNFAAAFELWRSNGERLPSRLPAVILLATTGLGYLSCRSTSPCLFRNRNGWRSASGSLASFSARCSCA